jgi:hypothetical protein
MFRPTAIIAKIAMATIVSMFGTVSNSGISNRSSR